MLGDEQLVHHRAVSVTAVAPRDTERSSTQHKDEPAGVAWDALCCALAIAFAEGKAGARQLVEMTERAVIQQQQYQQ